MASSVAHLPGMVCILLACSSREQREQPSGWMQVSAAEGSMNVAQLSEFRGILALVEQIISSTSSSLAFFFLVYAAVTNCGVETQIRPIHRRITPKGIGGNLLH